MKALRVKPKPVIATPVRLMVRAKLLPSRVVGFSKIVPKIMVKMPMKIRMRASFILISYISSCVNVQVHCKDSSF